MKTVNWELDLTYERHNGSFEVDDEVTSHEIDEMVRDLFWSIGLVQYNWDIEEGN